MSNPKTTIAGYLILAASIITVAAHFLQGGGFGAADIGSVVTAVTGLGLIASKDGSH